MLVSGASAITVSSPRVLPRQVDDDIGGEARVHGRGRRGQSGVGQAVVAVREGIAGVWAHERSQRALGVGR